MFCHRAILESVVHYIASIQISLNSKILLKLKSLLLTLSFTLPTTTEEDQKQTSTTNTMTSLFQYISDFLDISQLLTQRLLKQSYVVHSLKLSLQILSGRYHNPVDRYEISISQMTIDLVLLT
jgi:hypothetical protein